MLGCAKPWNMAHRWTLPPVVPKYRIPIGFETSHSHWFRNIAFPLVQKPCTAIERLVMCSQGWLQGCKLNASSQFFLTHGTHRTHYTHTHTHTQNIVLTRLVYKKPQFAHFTHHIIYFTTIYTAFLYYTLLI